MPHDDESTERISAPRTLPGLRRQRGDMTLDERLAAIEETQERILDKLGQGNTSFASLHLRMRALEVIVYGACGLGMVGLVGSVLYLVLKGGPAGHP